MRIYVKDVKDVDNNIQVINTKTGNDVTFLPGIGETILDTYIVLKKEWKTIAQDNGKLIVWCRKLGKLKITYLEVSGFMSKETILKEQEISEQNLYGIPSAGDKVILFGDSYQVTDIVKTWTEDNTVSEIMVKLKKQ